MTPAQRFPRLARATAMLFGIALVAAILSVWLPEGFAANLLECVIFSLALGWVAALGYAGVWPVLHPVLALLLIPVIVGVAQLAAKTTVTPWQTTSALAHWCSYAAASYLVLQICSAPAILGSLRRALIYFTFALALYSTICFFVAPGKLLGFFDSGYQDMVMGPFLNRDRYSALIELVLPAALYEAFAGKRVSVAYTAAAAAMFASVIAGASRAGSVLVVLESAVTLVLLSRQSHVRRSGIRGAAASFAALALVFTAIVGWQQLVERFHETIGFRGEMLASAVTMAKVHPLTGFGLGSFETVYPAYARFDIGVIVNHAHDDWAEWAADGGLFMLAALLGVLGYALRAALRRPWCLGVTCVAAHSLVDFPMQEPALVLVTVSVLCAALASESPRVSE